MSDINSNRTLNIYRFSNEAEFGNFMTNVVKDSYKGNILSIVGNDKGIYDSSDNTSKGYDIFLGEESLSKVKFMLYDDSTTTPVWRVLDSSAAFTNGETYLISGIDRMTDQYNSKVIKLTKYTGATLFDIVNTLDNRYYGMFHKTHQIFRKMYSLLYKMLTPSINGIHLYDSSGNICDPGIYEINHPLAIGNISFNSFTQVMPTGIYAYYNNEDVSYHSDSSNIMSMVEKPFITISSGKNELIPSISLTGNTSVDFRIAYTFQYDASINELIYDVSNYDSSIPLDPSILASHTENTKLVYMPQIFTYQFSYKIKAFWKSTYIGDNFDDTSINDITQSISDIMQDTYPVQPEAGQYISICSPVTFDNLELKGWPDTTVPDSPGEYLYICQPAVYPVPAYSIDNGTKMSFDNIVLEGAYNGVTYRLYASPSLNAQNIIIG